MNSLTERFLDTLRRENMLSGAENPLVLCALSGGADSAALLRLFWTQKERLGVRVEAAHVNHGLRGAESDADAAFCGDFCAALGVPLHAARADVGAQAARWGLGIEAAARRCRYGALTRIAADTGAAFLAVGHNANDALETALFHLARGTGAAGLGIRPVRPLPGGILLIRPLIDAPRTQIEEYLRAEGVQYRIDSSNASPAHTRNRIRAGVIPALEAAVPGAAERAAGALRRLRADDAFLQSLAEALCEKALPFGPALILDAAVLRDAPAPVAARAVLRLAARLTAEAADADCVPSARQVEAVLDLCAQDTNDGAASLPGGLEARRSCGALRLGPRDAPLARLTPRALREGETLALPEAGIQITVKRTKMTLQTPNTFHKFYVDSSAIHGILFVRPRRSGDALRPAGAGMAKNLKKWLIERRLPRHLRELLPVLACAPPTDGAFPDSGPEALAAAGGLGVAEDFVAVPGGEALEIRFSPLPDAPAALAPLHALLFRGDGAETDPEGRF